MYLRAVKLCGLCKIINENNYDKRIEYVRNAEINKAMSITHSRIMRIIADAIRREVK